MSKYIWKIKTAHPNNNLKNWLSVILAKNRGLNGAGELSEFLNPTLDQIISTAISQTEKAVDKVAEAIKSKEKIVVYSDYDADGICATAIMWETLNDLGASVMPYVPHRIKEGYGLASEAISQLAKEGVKLIITVDHGVTAVKQVEHAKKLGIDIIITDHHVLPKIQPKPFALVHTTQLCGAGVSWRFCWEIIQKLDKS